MAERIPARLTAKEGRRFGLTVGLAFLVLAGLAWWRGRSLPCVTFGAIGGLLIVGGLALPAYLGPVYRAWMGMAHLLSRITTPVFLGVVYYFVLTPVGLLMRLFRATPPTGWIARPTGAPSGRDMERQF